MLSRIRFGSRRVFAPAGRVPPRRIVRTFIAATSSSTPIEIQVPMRSMRSPCAAKRVPAIPTSAEIARTMTLCPPANSVPTNRLSSGVLTYALRVTLSIAARWSGSAP